MNMSDVPIGAWLEALGSRTPTPGGGAVAALCAAASAGLIEMVTGYTTGTKWAEREARMKELSARASQLRADALMLAEDDMTAFGTVSAAYKLPRATAEEKAARTKAVQAALTRAVVPPVQVGKLAAQLVEIAEELIENGNPSLVSDVAIASLTARAALEAAIINIEINRQQLRADTEIARLDDSIKDLGAAMKRADRVTAAVRTKIQR